MASEKEFLIKYDQQAYLDMWSTHEEPVVVNMAEAGFYVESFSGWGIPPRDVSAVKVADSDGEFISNEKYAPREMTMNISSDACDRAGYWDARSKLVELLSNNRTYYPSIEVVPDRYLQPANDAPFWSRWESVGYIEGTYPHIIPHTYYSAGDLFTYGRGNKGPLIWQKEIDGVKYHTYVHYSGGAEFSPRNLDEWHEWGVEESLQFTAYDPFVYLSDVREITFDQGATWVPPYYQIQFDYYGTERAYPIIELYGWAGLLKSPGDYVSYYIEFLPRSEVSDIITKLYGEIIHLKITYENMQQYYNAPTLDENSRVLVNLTPRSKGVYLASRDYVDGSAGVWRTRNLMDALQNDGIINSIHNFGLAGIGPGASDTLLPSAQSGSSSSGMWHRFEPGPTQPDYGPEIRISSVINSAAGDPAPPIKGAIVFYETYGGI